MESNKKMDSMAELVVELDPKSVFIPQKLPILDNRKILGLERSCKKLHGSKIGHF